MDDRNEKSVQISLKDFLKHFGETAGCNEEESWMDVVNVSPCNNGKVR
jgi:hypothetical protein